MLNLSSYNSAVYSSISSNSYFAFSVSESFIKSAECSNCTYESTGVPRDIVPTYTFMTLQFLINTNATKALVNLHTEARLGQLDRLEPAACLKQYDAGIQSTRRNVLLVARDSQFAPSYQNSYLNNSHVYWGSHASADLGVTRGGKTGGASDWICSGVITDECSDAIEAIKRGSNQWKVGMSCDESGCQRGKWPVEYCLSEKATPHCKVQLDGRLAVLVTVLNFGKSAVCLGICQRRA